MTEQEKLSEELLDGWLSMSMSIWNERLVTVMTYNESIVCNQLYKQKKQSGPPLTATELCARLQIHKPQMNVILNRLERSGMIERVRSQSDKRNVYILLTEKGIPVYEEAHREILRLPEALIARLGREKSRVFAATMKEVAACFDEIVKKAPVPRNDAELRRDAGNEEEAIV
ncbi:MAG: MarR family transcriptional regulator [Eubacteriales bacterium]|nr:MarR family transcriptional regulator [Eubacteriales bacterium]